MKLPNAKKGNAFRSCDRRFNVFRQPIPFSTGFTGFVDRAAIFRTKNAHMIWIGERRTRKHWMRNLKTIDGDTWKFSFFLLFVFHVFQASCRLQWWLALDEKKKGANLNDPFAD